MAKQPGFMTIEDKPLVPVDRAQPGDIQPAAVKPPAVVANWQDHRAEFGNRWTQTLVSDVVTAKDGSVPTPRFTIGDAEVACAFLRLDQTVLLRLYIKLGAGSQINTLSRDNGTVARTGDRGDTFMYLPFRVAAGNSYQFGIYGYTYTAGPTANGNHTNQSPYNAIPKIAGGSNELPISVWDALAHLASNPGDAVLGNLQFYWTAGDSLDLQLEYQTDEA